MDIVQGYRVKFDIALRTWSRNDILNGNTPLFRVDSGYCSGISSEI